MVPLTNACEHGFHRILQHNYTVLHFRLLPFSAWWNCFLSEFYILFVRCASLQGESKKWSRAGVLENWCELDLFLSVIELPISCWKLLACVDSVTKICPHFVDLGWWLYAPFGPWRDKNQSFAAIWGMISPACMQVSLQGGAIKLLVICLVLHWMLVL